MTTRYNGVYERHHASKKYLFVVIMVILTLLFNGCSCCTRTIDYSQKPYNAPVPYPILHYFVTEMCTTVHISVKNGHCGIFVWCIVGFELLYLCPNVGEVIRKNMNGYTGAKAHKICQIIICVYDSNHMVKHVGTVKIQRVHAIQNWENGFKGTSHTHLTFTKTHK